MQIVGSTNASCIVLHSPDALMECIDSHGRNAKVSTLSGNANAASSHSHARGRRASANAAARNPPHSMMVAPNEVVLVLVAVSVGVTIQPTKNT